MRQCIVRDPDPRIADRDVDSVRGGCVVCGDLECASLWHRFDRVDLDGKQCLLYLLRSAVQYERLLFKICLESNVMDL